MNKSDLVRNGIDALVCIGAAIGVFAFTKKRADEMIDAIPYEDGFIKGGSKAIGIGCVHGLIACTMAVSAMSTADELVRQIQK